MKKFIIRTSLLVLLLFVIVLIGIILPATPQDSNSLLFAQVQKDSLLEYVPSPRIIFVGGSNLSFGLNSKTVKEQLFVNPINTAVHASIGLEYMMDHALKFVRRGDVIVLVPEYAQYYGRTLYGGEELLRTVADFNPLELLDLGFEQKKNISSFLLKYGFSKFIISEYYGYKKSDIYSVKSFNEYGDAYVHWQMKQIPFPPFEQIEPPFNFETIAKIKEFHSAILEKGATLFVTYQPYQATSFNNSIEQIHTIEEELKKTGITILGTPERYKMPDSIMFNTPDHLLKIGVDYRTELLIEDYKNARAHN